MLIERGAYFYCIQPDRMLSRQCLLTFNNCKSLHKTMSKQSLVYDQNFYWGKGVMDGAGITVKGAWVKAKVVRRNEGVQMVSSPLPPPP